MLQIYYSIIVGFAIYNLGAPKASTYLSDFINLLLMLSLLGTQSGRRRICDWKSRCKYSCVAIMGFFVVGTMSALVNFSGISSIILYFWSLRNYFRFFIFFIAVACYLEKRKLSNIFKNLRYILYLSTILSIYQYFVMGYGKTGHSGDLIGGIFGTATQGNAAICLFAAGLCVYYICGYVRKEASLVQVASVIACALISAVLGEIKFFFFVLIAIGIVLIISNKPNLKTIIITVFGGIILSYAVAMVQIYYVGSGTKSLNSIEGIISYVTTSSYSYTTDSINRIGGIATIKRLFFSGKNSLFGVGLGMADHSSFFSSAIYKQYGYINYSWFMLPYLFLETGWIGVVSYIAIYMGMFVDILKKRPYLTVAKKSGIVLSVVSLMMIVYNSSLRVDTAYVYFAFLAIPFIPIEDEDIDNVLNVSTRIRVKFLR
jgi:hypothetical protein